MINNKPLVSVITITYNHEKYIKDTIEGVASQKCNFDVEFIISNDCSSDNTHSSIEKALEEIEIPDNIKIRYYNHTKNKGINENFIFCCKKAEGKYLAYCEGDDFWTDPIKLRTQVSILESNDSISMSTHEAAFQSTLMRKPNTFRRFASIIINDIRLYGFSKFFTLTYLFLFENKNFWKQKRTHDSLKRKTINTLDDFKDNTYYMAFCSIVVRSKIILSHIDCFENQEAGHQTSLLLAAMNGKIHHSKKVMSVKRDQESSITKDMQRLKRTRDLNKNPETNEFILRFKKLKNYAKNDKQKSIFDNLISIVTSKISQ